MVSGTVYLILKGMKKLVNEDNLKKNQKALSVIQAYKAFFSSEEGKVILQDLAEKCFMLTPVTDVSQPNGFTATSAFYDGKRAVFIDIIKMSACDEKNLVKLLQDTERKKYE